MTERKTGANPKTVDGVTFECWHVGIQRYEWRSLDGRIAVHDNWNGTAWLAYVDTSYIKTGEKAKRFRTQTNAMSAGVRLAKS